MKTYGLFHSKLNSLKKKNSTLSPKYQIESGHTQTTRQKENKKRKRKILRPPSERGRQRDLGLGVEDGNGEWEVGFRIGLSRKWVGGLIELSERRESTGSAERGGSQRHEQLQNRSLVWAGIKRSAMWQSTAVIWSETAVSTGWRERCGSDRRKKRKKMKEKKNR